MACDPLFADVSLLISGNGTGAATYKAVDDSNNALALTGPGVAGAFIPTGGPFGDPDIDLANPAGGATAAYSVQPATSIASAGPLDLSVGDYTIEGWFYSRNSSGGHQLFCLNNGGIFNISTSGNKLYAAVDNAGGITASVFTLNTWHHVALVMQSNAFVIYLDGVAAAAPISVTRTSWVGSIFFIGAYVGGPTWPGAFNNFRITKGVARYTANFTPPSAPFGVACTTGVVPNTVGNLLATGEAAIVSAGLAVGSVTQGSDPVINSGYIIGTSPIGGTTVTLGSNVDILESNVETVPNVTGELLAAGESALTGAGFTVGTVTQTSDPVINSGYIIGTSPIGGTRATAGSAVDISESNSETVPDVINIPLAGAESALVAAGFAVGTVTTATSLTIPGGNVISTSPVAGVREIAGSSIDIVESSGSGTGTVPNVLNISQALAEAAITAAGFVVGAVTFQSDPITIAGNVDVQNPAGGTSAFLTSPVNITISTGLAALRVPDLFGLTQSAAIILLLSLGLVPGAIGSAPSQFVPPNTVMTQNPSAGTPVASGSVVSFVISLGVLAAGEIFDFEATVISQYANSPTILQLCNNLNQYIDQSTNFANFFNYVWNVDTAVGFGLDIWGKIVGVSRLLLIPNTTDYVGFFMPSESQPDQDWQPMGSDQPPQPAVGGAMYTGHNATETYLLDDDAYRQLILAKAFANIAATTAPAINQILQNLYGPGTAFVLNTGPMSISYNLTFTPTAIQLAILQQSGVIPTPPGVSFVINTDV